jgi:hypothetical protein
VSRIEYQETAVGRLPVGPAADAALAAAAADPAATVVDPAASPARPHPILAQRVPTPAIALLAVTAAAAAAIAIVVRRRSTS